MVDIELLVKIPEEMYAQIIDENGMDTMMIPYTDIIKSGIPLPKGHGKIVDVEDIKDNIRRWNGYLDEDMISRINFAMEHHIPTIINADTTTIQSLDKAIASLEIWDKIKDDIKNSGFVFWSGDKDIECIPVFVVMNIINKYLESEEEI